MLIVIQLNDYSEFIAAKVEHDKLPDEAGVAIGFPDGGEVLPSGMEQRPVKFIKYRFSFSVLGMTLKELAELFSRDDAVLVRLLHNGPQMSS